MLPVTQKILPCDENQPFRAQETLTNRRWGLDRFDHLQLPFGLGHLLPEHEQLLRHRMSRN
jgi:hypothetical protein